MKALPIAALTLALLGCRERRQDVPAPPAPLPGAVPLDVAVREAPRCDRASAARPLPKPLATSGTGGVIALARAERGTIAYIADEDTGAIHTVDIDARAELAVTPLKGTPGQLLIAADGRVIVALRDRSAIEVLEPEEDLRAPLSHLCLSEAPAEPVGLAATPDGETLLVASRWGHALTAYSMADARRISSVDLPRDPYAVIASADGKKAIVSHVAGARMSVVDLGSATAAARAVDVHPVEFMARRRHFKPMPKPEGESSSSRSVVERHERFGTQAFALARTTGGRILMPEVLVDTGPAGGRAGGYGDSMSTPVVVGDISVIDPATEAIRTAPLQGGFGPHDCLLPRAAAMDETGGRLLVACLGIDEVISYAAAKDPPHSHELGRWQVAAGPTGIAVDQAGKRALVWSQFDSAVSVIALGDALLKPEVVKIPINRPAPLDPEVDVGRRVFHAAGGLRIAADGRACASCHPDGRDDALTWSSPEGPRQTPMLLGRLEGTAPYGWSGEGGNLTSHFARTLARLSGMGIPAKERGAIFAYVRSLLPPVRAASGGLGAEPPSLTGPSRRDAAVVHGDTLFHDKETGCSSCHLDDDLSTDHATHDVRSATPFDTLSKFDTPSLRFIGRTAPYFHDGRYPTLIALLKGVDGTMGHTKQLTVADLEDLSAYLSTL